MRLPPWIGSQSSFCPNFLQRLIAILAACVKASAGFSTSYRIFDNRLGLAKNLRTILMVSSTDADRALRDLRDVVVRSTIWSSLANADIRSKYRLSTFGSLWITLTTGAMALAIGLFYGQFFGQDMHSYLPYFTASFITWTFIASVIGEASLTLVGPEPDQVVANADRLPHPADVTSQSHRLLHNANRLDCDLAVRAMVALSSAVLSLVGLVLLYCYGRHVGYHFDSSACGYRDIPPLISGVNSVSFFF